MPSQTHCSLQGFLPKILLRYYRLCQKSSIPHSFQKSRHSRPHLLYSHWQEVHFPIHFRMFSLPCNAHHPLWNIHGSNSWFPSFHNKPALSCRDPDATSLRRPPDPQASDTDTLCYHSTYTDSNQLYSSLSPPFVSYQSTNHKAADGSVLLPSVHNLLAQNHLR